MEMLFMTLLFNLSIKQPPFESKFIEIFSFDLLKFIDEFSRNEIPQIFSYLLLKLASTLFEAFDP